MADTTTSALNWATVENGKVKTTTSKKSDESNNGTMGYDQFLTLLCAEMQYQDPLEPTSNTEYVAQLATFSQLEAMLGMQDTQKNEMANNLVGKYVILKVSDETTGKTSYVDGKVDYVMYQEDGSQMLSVNNKLYSIDTLDTVADSDYYEAIGYAKTISNMLAQLPDIENITTKYSGAIEQIRKVYDGMTDYQKSFVSESDLAKLKKYEQKIKDLDLSRRSAELELKKLKKKVGDGVIKSTVEGVVKEATDEASAKNENKPVVSVVGEEGFYVTGRVGETMLDQIKEGMTATVMSWQSGESYEATVTGVGNSPVSDYSTGENQNQSFYPFTLVIHGDANLSNGESVNLSMNGIAAGSDGSIYLEKMFVREEGNRYYVYKRGDNGRLTKQYVEVGKNMYNSLEITSGLTMDDLIAFPYGRDVKEGAKTQEADTLYDYY